MSSSIQLSDVALDYLQKYGTNDVPDVDINIRSQSPIKFNNRATTPRE